MEITISGDRLSEILGVDKRQVRNLATDSIVVKLDRDKYDLLKSIKNYIDIKFNSSKENEESVSSFELSSLLGISERSISNYAKRGIVVRDPKRNGKYFLRESCKKYIQELQKYEDPLAAKKKTEAELQAIKLQELKKQLHRVDVVEEMINKLVFSIKDRVGGIPSRLAIKVSEETDVNKVEAILTDEIEKVLLQLSEINLGDKNE